MIIDCLNFCTNLAVVQKFINALDKLKMALKAKWKTNGQDCEAVHVHQALRITGFHAACFARILVSVHF